MTTIPANVSLPSVNRATHWASEYIGKPWRNGARGPNAFDCWGLIYWVYLRNRSIILPKYSGVDATDHAQVSNQIFAALKDKDNPWMNVLTPSEFSAVGMGNVLFTHVGLWTEQDGGRIVHCGEKMSVVAWPINKLRSMYRRIEFFDFHGAHH